MEHEAENQLAAFALGALGSEERQKVALHLAECSSCQEALADYSQIADGLLHILEPVAPRRGIRARLGAELGNQPEAGKRRISLRAAPAVRIGLAVGLALLLFVNLGFLLQSQDLLKQTQTALYQQQVGQTAFAIASYPSSVVAEIQEDGVRGTFVYEPDLPVGVIYIWGLQPPPQDKAYQAWLVDPEGKRLDGGLLHFGDDRGFGWLMIEAPSPMTAFTSLGITLEPAGGSPAPTGPRIVGTDF